MEINIKKEYQQFQKKIKDSGLKSTIIMIENKQWLVHNNPETEIEENWTDGSLFALYILYKYFVNPEEWRKFVRKNLYEKFEDIDKFDILDHCISWTDNFELDVLKHLKYLSDNPGTFILETLNYFDYSHPYIRTETRKIIEKCLSEDDLESFDLYIRMNIGDGDY
jgi:hypothetical protein